MTAEAALLNREAVALAADSAVTIRSAHGEKIFQSANKIFSMPAPHAIGIMIYGTASCMGVPWETVIKLFRANLGKTPLPTVKSYATAFFKFIDTFADKIDAAAENEYVVDTVGGYLRLIVEEIRRTAAKQMKSRGLSRADVFVIVRTVVKERCDAINAGEESDGTTPVIAAQLAAAHGELIASLVGECFKKLPLGKVPKARLLTVLPRLLTRFPSDAGRPSTTGLVVTGFGADEIFPALQAFEVEGFHRCGFTKRREDNRTKNGRGGIPQVEALIYPFAQQEMVFTFMEGVNPDYQELFEHLFGRVVTELPNRLVAQNPGLSPQRRGLIASKLAAEGRQLLREVFREMEEFRQREFTRPVMQMVRLLPKDELAAMAEALVNLTSFKRRVTPEAETVGGPIDVAVISKGDGFIWIKRKHYFAARYNPQFMARYGGPIPEITNGGNSDQ